ncbi:MAG: DUF3429 domain-containing protein [Casimicrobium sp.]
MPRYVALLGYGGLMPFVGLAGLQWIDTQRATLWAHAFVSYGAVILSFVGAVHWGVAISTSTLSDAQRVKAFVWSVVPALLAWLAMMMNQSIALLILLLGFIVHFIRDQRLVDAATLPTWYLPLRKRLTLVVCLCIVASASRSIAGG